MNSTVDIITISKALLREHKQLLEYVKIPDHNFSYKNNNKSVVMGLEPILKKSSVQLEKTFTVRYKN